MCLWEVGKDSLEKGAFVNRDVYFQNMAIRSCIFESQGAIKSQKVIV